MRQKFWWLKKFKTMAEFLKVEAVNVDEAIASLKDFGKECDEVILKATADTAMAVESIAKKRLRGQLGSRKHWIHGAAGLAGSIYMRVEEKEGIVGTGKHYAPYIEFGTGREVFKNFDFDAEAKSNAAQYRGRGIRKVNISGDSYLYFAAKDQEKEFYRRIEEGINKLLGNG